MATALDPALNPDVFGMQPRLPTMPKPTPLEAAEQRLAGTEKELGAALKQQADFAGVQAEQEQRQIAKKAKGESEILGRQAEEMRAAEEPIRVAEEEKMKARFSPTRETATDMAALYSLVGVLGFAIGRGGKNNAMQAMSAMNGMLEGYRQGSVDRFNQEKKLFDSNLKSMTDNINMLTNRLQRIAQLSTVDKLKAEQELAVTLAEGNADFVKQNINKFGLPATIQYLKQVQTAAQRAVDKERDFERKAEQKARDAAEAREREKDRQAFQEKLQNVRLGAAAARKGGQTSALLAGRAENIREAFAQAATDIVNITKFPKGTMLGTFAGLTGASADGMINGIRNAIARGVTEKEQRMLEALIAGVEGHLAFALGGGYATSQSKARMDQYKAQLARAGDDPAMVPLMLARFKQEMNILAENFPSKPGATPEMNNAVQKYASQINDAVPFTVEDVIEANIGTSPPQAARTQSGGSAGGWTVREK